MSSEPHDSNPGVEQDGAGEHPEETVDSPALTIALPDGCESVSDAIVTNREMLREPQDHGLATDEDIVHLSEAIEGLSGTVEEVSQQYEESQDTVSELTQQHEETEATVSELRETVERQRAQIDELQSMVTSLTEILGTEAEWDTFENA